MTSTYFQTCLLWVLAYLTLFIKISNFSDRLMGSITALLVLAAFLVSITSALPKTSYFKYIDLWFMWFLLNIFTIILFHIIIDRLPDDSNQVHSNIDISETQYIKKKKEKVNFMAIIILPLITIIFSTMYFILSNTV